MTEKSSRRPIVPDDVMFNKAAVIERSLRRVLEICRADPDLADMMHVDALTLNVERACQGAIFATSEIGFVSTPARWQAPALR